MKYIVLSNLVHDGQKFSRGDEIQLSAETAEALLKDGIISNEKVPVVKEANWKEGPKDIIRDSDAEVKPDGTISSVDSETGEEEEVQTQAAEEVEESENKIAGDDTAKIDEEADAGL